MKLFNKTATWGLLLIVSFLQLSSVVFAADPVDTSKSGTLLPATSTGVVGCEALMNEVSKNSCWVKLHIFKVGNTCTGADIKPDIDDKKVTDTEVLACGIKTGSIHLWMIPYYIRYILQFIIGMSGLAAVGGIIYGGYMYLFAGVSSEKDQGKKAIQYGIIGMVMTLVAWAFVNIIISLVTG
jgi:hypothetical protein